MAALELQCLLLPEALKESAFAGEPLLPSPAAKDTETAGDTSSLTGTLQLPGNLSLYPLHSWGHGSGPRPHRVLVSRP